MAWFKFRKTAAEKRKASMENEDTPPSKRFANIVSVQKAARSLKATNEVEQQLLEKMQSVVETKEHAVISVGFMGPPGNGKSYVVNKLCGIEQLAESTKTNAKALTRLPTSYQYSDTISIETIRAKNAIKGISFHSDSLLKEYAREDINGMVAIERFLQTCENEHEIVQVWKTDDKGMDGIKKNLETIHKKCTEFESDPHVVAMIVNVPCPFLREISLVDFPNAGINNIMNERIIRSLHHIDVILTFDINNRGDIQADAIRTLDNCGWMHLRECLPSFGVVLNANLTPSNDNVLNLEYQKEILENTKHCVNIVYGLKKSNEIKKEFRRLPYGNYREFASWLNTTVQVLPVKVNDETLDVFRQRLLEMIAAFRERSSKNHAEHQQRLVVSILKQFKSRGNAAMKKFAIENLPQEQNGKSKTFEDLFTPHLLYHNDLTLRFPRCSYDQWEDAVKDHVLYIEDQPQSRRDKNSIRAEITKGDAVQVSGGVNGIEIKCPDSVRKTIHQVCQVATKTMTYNNQFSEQKEFGIYPIFCLCQGSSLVQHALELFSKKIEERGGRLHYIIFQIQHESNEVVNTNGGVIPLNIPFDGLQCKAMLQLVATTLGMSYYYFFASNEIQEYNRQVHLYESSSSTIPRALFSMQSCMYSMNQNISDGQDGDLDRIDALFAFSILFDEIRPRTGLNPEVRKLASSIFGKLSSNVKETMKNPSEVLALLSTFQNKLQEPINVGPDVIKYLKDVNVDNFGEEEANALKKWKDKILNTASFEKDIQTFIDMFKFMCQFPRCMTVSINSKSYERFLDLEEKPTHCISKDGTSSVTLFNTISRLFYLSDDEIMNGKSFQKEHDYLNQLVLNGYGNIDVLSFIAL